MASSILQQHSAVVVPFAIPAQVSPAVEVTQAEIVALLELRAKINRLSEQAEAAEQSIKGRLVGGASVEEGAHVARLKESARANIPWKGKAMELAERLGMDAEAWAKNVSTHTAKTVTVKLDIE